MPLVRYLTHPQVQIDPHRDVRLWRLSGAGHMRVAALAASGALRGTTRIVSSAETKALDTAGPIADSLNLRPEIWQQTGENDRSTTGFLPPEEFEKTADTFFAAPETSVRGWETAQAAQSRIVDAVNNILADPPSGDILLVGHGAVGTLLWCHLFGVPISRQYDQGPGGGGNWFAFDADNRTPLSGWQPMETL